MWVSSYGDGSARVPPSGPSAIGVQCDDSRPCQSRSRALMTRLLWIPLLAFAPALVGREPPAKPAGTPGAPATQFVTAHCVKCHGPEKPSGGVRLDDLPADPAKDVERWAAVRDQIRDGLMPPAKQ
ncbi:MAG: hypothetical protein FJ304_28035, partial [Planctomycetes bacterium]|nr:hypothetical protein [Planctomycetota bacterium]